MQRDRAQLAAEAAALAAALASLGIDRRGLSPWRQVETGAGYTAELEAEVNHLRRTIDQLQARIGR
jgi:sugar phosphate isomerase/epimerase